MTLKRVAELGRPNIAFKLDGDWREGFEGDTVMTALLAGGDALRVSEFGDGPRAGFCWMGACQDCWVTIDGMGRVRACQTPLAAWMEITRS